MLESTYHLADLKSVTTESRNVSPCMTATPWGLVNWKTCDKNSAFGCFDAIWTQLGVTWPHSVTVYDFLAVLTDLACRLESHFSREMAVTVRAGGVCTQFKTVNFIHTLKRLGFTYHYCDWSCSMLVNGALVQKKDSGFISETWDTIAGYLQLHVFKRLQSGLLVWYVRTIDKTTDIFSTLQSSYVDSDSVGNKNHSAIYGINIVAHTSPTCC